MASFQVFISHRGEEVKNAFADCLHHELKQRGITSFLDVEVLLPGEVVRPGEDVRERMLNDARTAIIGVPIFTQIYGSSVWCLDELVEMMDSQRNRLSKVIPVFYDVKPEELRMEDGPFAQKLKDYLGGLQHEEERIKRWKDALQEASWLVGFKLKNYDGRQGQLLVDLVETIVNEIADGLPVDRLPTAVGLPAKVQDAMQGFRLHEKTSVFVLLVWGMGGIGKTTLARAIYDMHREGFKGSSFVEKCEVEKALEIQDRLRKDLLLDTGMGNDLARGRARLRDGLQKKKVLIVLDDMKRSDGMNCDFSSVREIIDPTSLCPGSLILLTSRDQRLFPHKNDLSDVFRGEIYDLQIMEPQESWELFCRHAFNRPSADPGFEELAKQIVEACHGLPLSLEVLGRHLSGMGENKRLWNEALIKLRSNEYKKISGTLRISYEALDAEEQRMFQDVACFFSGEHEWRAKNFWEGLVKSYETGLKKLKQLCLVKVDEDRRLTMHDHLRDLGRDVSRSSKTWVWEDKDLKQMLDDKQGLDQIRGLLTSLARLDARDLSKMRSLQLLRLHSTDLKGSCKGLQGLRIRWLSFMGSNNTTLPKDLSLESLTVLKVSWTDQKHKVCCWYRQHKVRWWCRKHKLSCRYGRSTCFSQMKRLRELDIGGCTGLKELPEDFGSLESLESLTAWGLRSITKLPSSFGQLKRLRELDIGGCTGLKELPEDFGSLESLESLQARRLESITKLPSSFGQLKRLRELDIRHCRGLKELPEDFGSLESLESLQAGGLESITKLPSSFGQLKRLRELHIGGCTGLKELPEDLVHLF